MILYISLDALKLFDDLNFWLIKELNEMVPVDGKLFYLQK